MNNNFKILVATDYSETATNAVRYAVQLANDTGSEVNFLHVYKPAVKYPTQFAALENFDGAEEFEERELQQYVDDIIRSLNINADKLACKYVVRQGKAGEEICKEAIYSDVDFIVMGTHGASALHRAFLGSHTWTVIKKASIPVLAVPIEALYTGVHNFILGTEYRTGELPVVKFLSNWIKPFNGKLTLFHVSNDVFPEKFEKELLEKFNVQIKETLQDGTPDISLIYDNNLVKGLEDFCLREKASWLVMSPEKSVLWEKLIAPIISATKRMSFYTHVPLFTIPDYYNSSNFGFWKKNKEKHLV
ncbi:MAG: universal stress protein [Bacteroidia bacterium]